MAKILIIDDDGLARDALEVFLTRDGHKVTTAADGGSGTLAFRQNQPDLVVLDRNLPIMSGSEVLKQIRGLSASVPVVVVTGYDEPEDADKYIRAGATAFLSKKNGLLNVLNEIDRLMGFGRQVAVSRPAGQATMPEASVPSKGTVLIADDDPELLRALARFLTFSDYEVITAENGARAVELALARRPAVAILDIIMPVKDGVQVLRELVPELPRTSFIMLSGNDDADVARACLRIGACEYVPKPPRMETLEGLIRAHILIGRPG